jgi:hypothetical protein
MPSSCGANLTPLEMAVLQYNSRSEAVCTRAVVWPITPALARLLAATQPQHAHPVWTGVEREHFVSLLPRRARHVP